MHPPPFSFPPRPFNRRLAAGLVLPGALLGALACEPQPAAPDAASAEAVEAAAVAANTWTARANMPSDRINTTTASVVGPDNRTTLYVIGGRNTASTAGFCAGGLSTVQAYDATSNTWRSRAPFPNPIQNTNGAGVIDGKIYLSGGCFDYGGYSGRTYMYDPATNTWTEKKEMSGLGYRGVSAVINNKLYVLSSCEGQSDCTAQTGLFFGYYNPATDSWTKLPDPPSRTAHHGGGAAAIGGRFYTAGGVWTKAVEIFDPATNQWTTGASLGSFRVNVAYAAVAARLYIIAGTRREFDGEGGVTSTPVATTSVYDPATNAWRNVRPAPRSGIGLAAARVFVGGSPRVELVGGARPGNNQQYTP